MVEMLGIFEVNEEEGYVRVKHSENDYEYVVSEKNYEEKSYAATSLFLKAYRLGVSQTQSEIKRVIGLR